MSQVLRGTPVAQKILAEVRQYAQAHPLRLDIILVGHHEASHIYVSHKLRQAEKVGIKAVLHHLPEKTTTAEVVSLIQHLNETPEVTGMIVQLPLPAHISEQAVLDAIAPSKDADALHPQNLGLLAQGRARWAPATPWGIVELLLHYDISPAGKHVAIVGRGRLVGTPLTLLLSRPAAYGNATVTLCHTYTRNLYAYTREADIVVVAIGRPQWFGAEGIKPGAVIIDVGIHREGGHLIGDVQKEALEKAGAYTPVPGGVGPLTVACLLNNVCRLHEAAQSNTAGLLSR
ncbi:MAG: bifunctional 5,10-methylenetetrahydrofolate dehydrogenase/5,10-methenyltetrahydrofolate cyclohydrolase [Bacteroidia bacterium]|nr:bifunctional 5,10-methylenetetrahydrofolate dehydrogenase/5,10-methenyltetrahydrofolate cyclohydrolase [Bacteroidia bacterium]MCX7764402.1 bifunctional 5,10-methylenetetrahydrofolate dehydrogenase/5,10-methenyltetrahydrofolate cyclohydrolase [Bacteroidia bacterium]MDW8056689.1 bifunctional 5,10-methylenetetrahydrofolate dehydrogenase/5,10-methenyltetrahydrofolate cyclohydrolase [Bacteroidia bacterium]